MASGLLLGISVLAGVALGWPAVAVVVPLVLAAHLIRKSGACGAIAWSIASVLLGAAVSHVADTQSDCSTLGTSTNAVVTVRSLPVAGGSFERALADVHHVIGEEGGWTVCHGQALLYFPENGEGVSPGDRLYVGWSVTPTDHLAPGYGGFVRSQGAMGSGIVFWYDVEEQGPRWLDWMSAARRHVGGALERDLPGDAGALASGMVTGDDAALSERAQAAFQATGTGHITSVSGQNVTIVLGIAAGWFRPGRKLTRVVTTAVLVAVVWGYVVLVGMESPALRAAIVATLGLIAPWFGRRPDPLSALSLTLGAMALANPLVVHQTGFWLSASASAALCTVLAHSAAPSAWRAFRSVVLASLAASFATLPFVIFTFGQWSPMSPIANMLISPLVDLAFAAIYPFAVLASIAPWASGLIRWAPAGLLIGVLWMIERLADLSPQGMFAGAGIDAALLVAIPCVLFIAAMSRDARRWRSLLVKRLSSGAQESRTP